MRKPSLKRLLSRTERKVSLHVTIHPEVFEQVDEWALKHGISRSRAAEVLLIYGIHWPEQDKAQGLG